MILAAANCAATCCPLNACRYDAQDAGTLVALIKAQSTAGAVTPSMAS